MFEESLSHWSGEWFTALTTKYGFTKPQAVYFSTHEEADMDTHQLGEGGEEAMGHGAFNRSAHPRPPRWSGIAAPAIRWSTAL